MPSLDLGEKIVLTCNFCHTTESQQTWFCRTALLNFFSQLLIVMHHSTFTLFDQNLPPLLSLPLIVSPPPDSPLSPPSNQRSQISDLSPSPSIEPPPFRTLSSLPPPPLTDTVSEAGGYDTSIDLH
ncbi:Uncharacterized protein Rs2_13178 [Raphanus sativus]|nr:Uncharacterized protein Rs2_13178 [Raphanus sativus]